MYHKSRPPYAQKIIPSPPRKYCLIILRHQTHSQHPHASSHYPERSHSAGITSNVRLNTPAHGTGGGTGLHTEQSESGASSGLQLDTTASLSQLPLGRLNLASSGHSSNSSGRETVSSSSNSSTIGEAGSGSGNHCGGGEQEKGGPGGASSRAFTSRDPVLSRVLRESLAAEVSSTLNMVSFRAGTVKSCVELENSISFSLFVI